MFLELFKPKNRVAKYGNPSFASDQYDEYIHGEQRLDGMLTQVMPIREFRDKLHYIIRGYPAVKVPRCPDDCIDFNAAKKMLEVISMVDHIPHIYGYIAHHNSDLSSYGQLMMMWHTIINGKRMQMVVAFNPMYMRLYQIDLTTGQEDYRVSDVIIQIHDAEFIAKECIGRKFIPIPYVRPVLTELISHNHAENVIINSLFMVPRKRKLDYNYETQFEYYYNSGDIILRITYDGLIMLGSPWYKDYIIMPIWEKKTRKLLDKLGNTLKSQEYYVL
jgi:hypothetical protein